MTYIIKYGKGLTWIKDSLGVWKPVKGAWQKETDGTWHPITRGNLKVDNTTWTSIYPTPRGVLTPIPASVSFSPYQYHTEPDNDIDGNPTGKPTQVTLTNTGDYDLRIDYFTVNNAAGYSVNLTTPTLPILLEPQQSSNIGIRVKGLIPGTYSGNITVSTNIGVLGQVSDGIPMSVTVRPDFSDIGVTPKPINLTYYVQDVAPNIVTLSSGSGTYTVPSNVDQLAISITGGGGGGGGASDNEEPVYGGGGGGGGAVTNTGIIAVTPGQTFSYSIGAGGSGGGIGGSGGSGGTTTFGLYTAIGGAGGQTNGIPGGNGGAGGYTEDEVDVAGGTGGTPNGGAGGGYSEGAEIGYSGSNGGNGSVVIAQYPIQTTATAVVTIKNTGNGANLIIDGNSVSSNRIRISALPTAIGYNWSAFTGNSSTFTATAANLAPGVYQDTIQIISNSQNNPVYQIPVTTTVIVPSGRQEFETPGTYNWVVPESVHRLDILAVGGGGAGAPGLSNSQVLQGGGGGGGGSGGSQYNTAVKVIPGETLTVTVGDGGGSNLLTNYQYYPVSLGAWSGFMNSYAVWTHPSGVAPTGKIVSSRRKFTAPSNGYYTILAQADNYLEVYVDEVLVLTTSTFTGESATQANVYMRQGNHKLTFNARNDGGPAGIAVAIQNIVGTQLWNTRTLLDPAAGDTGEATIISGSFGTIQVGGGQGGQAAYNSGVIYYPVGGSEGGESSPGADSGDGGGGGGGGGCFLPHTLIKMGDGSEKRISQIKPGDYVLEALTNKPAKVIGVKTRAHDINKWVFALNKDEMPYITEEHPWYNDDDELCAMSSLCEQQAPWLGSIKIVDVENKIKLSQDVIVYNLMLETGESHYANGVRVNNIVKTGTAYVLLYKGYISKGDYESYIYGTANREFSPDRQIRIFNIFHRASRYILDNDTWKSHILAQTLAWAIKNRETVQPILDKWFNSTLRKLILGRKIK